MQVDMFLSLVESADAGNAEAELALDTLIDPQDLEALAQRQAQQEIVVKQISEGDAWVVPTDISAEGYVKLADGLLVATIMEAFGVSRGGAEFKVTKKASKMAWEWLLTPTSELDKGWPLSYENCCWAAGVDPVELRDALILLREYWIKRAAAGEAGYTPPCELQGLLSLAL